MRAYRRSWEGCRARRCALGFVVLVAAGGLVAAACGSGVSELAGEDRLPSPSVASETTVSTPATETTAPEPRIVDGGFDGDSFTRSVMGPSGESITATFPTDPRDLPGTLADGTGRVATTYTLTTDLELGVHVSVLVAEDRTATCSEVLAAHGATPTPEQPDEGGSIIGFRRVDGPRVFLGQAWCVTGEVFTLEVSYKQPGRYSETEAGLVLTRALDQVEPPF